MEHVTPTDLLWIAGMVVVVCGSAFVLAYWPEICAVVHRYVHVWVAGDDDSNDPDPPQNASNNNATTQQQRIATPQNTSNELLLLRGQAAALAALVAAGKVNQTEGIKLVFGVSPSSTGVKYNAAKDALHAELQRIQRGGVDYPPLTPEQQEARADLNLD